MLLFCCMSPHSSTFESPWKKSCWPRRILRASAGFALERQIRSTRGSFPDRRFTHAKRCREVCQELRDGNLCIGPGKVFGLSCKCVSICLERAGERKQDVSIFPDDRSYGREIAVAEQTREQTRSHHEQARVIIFPEEC